jgi:CheY-like chemotaxis protein
MAEKILIVDDEPDVARLIGLVLERNGLEVVTATSGPEAIAKAAAVLPALILLDIMMPGMDGYEVCRRLRADPQLSHIPIIFLTAKNEVADRIAGFEAGADEYVSKPVHLGELSARVNGILNRTAAIRAALARSAHVVGILGVKGGLGTTTLAVNLAVSCASPPHAVNTILAEMLPGMGLASFMLGMGHMEGLGMLLRSSPEEINARLVENWLATHSTGLRLLFAPLLHQENTPAWTPALAEAILYHLRRMADLVLLDLGAGLTPVNRALIGLVNHVILTFDPHPLTVTLLERTLKAISTIGGGANHIDLVMINRAPSSQTMTVQMVQEAVNRPVTQVLSPAPEAMFLTAQHRLPLVISDPQNMVSTQYQELAQKVLVHAARARRATGPLQPVTGPLF